MRILTAFIALIALIFQSCTSDNSGGGMSGKWDGYLITGNITNATPDTRIFLEDLQKQTNRIIDTARVEADGSFTFKGKVDAPTIGQMRMGAQKIFLILENEESMEITMDTKVPNVFDVKGSQANEGWKQVYDKLRTRQATPPYLKSVSDTSSNILLSYLAINQLKIEDEYEYFKAFGKKMEKEMPGSKLTADMQSRIAASAALANLGIGKQAPDIKLASPDGKEMSLSELEGQVVLLDFWASWCRPCRRENPNVVAAYDKYKSKGFTVYSVSLDRTASKWEKAIKDDNLKWKYHVSDLQGWKSGAAATYGVKSIPQTFLIGKDGSIVAKNLRGPALERKLEELLGA